MIENVADLGPRPPLSLLPGKKNDFSFSTADPRAALVSVLLLIKSASVAFHVFIRLSQLSWVGGKEPMMCSHDSLYTSSGQFVLQKKRLVKVFLTRTLHKQASMQAKIVPSIIIIFL